MGTHATIETRTPILFLDAHVTPGGSVTIDIPADYNGFVYVWRGAGFLGQEEVPAKLGQVIKTSSKHCALSNSYYVTYGLKCPH